MSMHFKEIELKYCANGIDMEAFVQLTNKFNPNWIMVSSFDDYFTNEAGEFIRYRYTDEKGELTIKRKTTESNNINRIEVNLKTEGKNFATVKAFVDLLGYQLNFSIYKTCKIAFLDKIVLCYYVVYDEKLNELQRFIEVEAREDITWGSEDEAWDEVQKYEAELAALGITEADRLDKSLFELFRKS